MHPSIVEHISYERGKHATGTVDDKLSNVQFQLEELLYMVGDQPVPPTEDELMNYIIGMIESVKIKRSQLKVAQSRDVS